ncbi:MAG: hypothetical protein ACI9XZ_001823, partial [Alphaproteobacteria bacterium]
DEKFHVILGKHQRQEYGAAGKCVKRASVSNTNLVCANFAHYRCFTQT